jgi:hypothetical protein
MKDNNDVSPWLYVLAGTVLGAGVAALIVAGQDSEDGEPGFISKVLEKIPTRVKVAGGFGAVRGAGSEAGREIKEKFEESVNG